jgi:hypothetical protein
LGSAARAALSAAMHAMAPVQPMVRANAINEVPRKGDPLEEVTENYSAASLCPSLALSLWISSSAASEITVPGGKIASAPALYSAS